MPINPSALGGDSAPKDDTQNEVDAQQDPAVAAEPAKRTRRTKAELIEAAVVPGNDDQVDLKDLGTGAKIQRPWLVALEMVRGEKAEFADKSMKYAMLKHDQQKVASAFETSSEETGERQPAPSAPPESEVGDEVRIGSDVFCVGHGGVLTNSPVSVDGEIVKPKRTWQRELGSGGRGPWEVVQVHPEASQENAKTNGKGDEAKVETLPAGVSIEPIGDGVWKVGTGILEKIGLPDYSSLQVGPISASRTAADDGRRTVVQIGDRQASIPSAVVEVAREAMDIVEYIARYQRGELVSFLESTGALKQPSS